MTDMRVFQIQKNEVLIINGDKQYSDTVENFKLDSKLALDNINEVIYDNYQECCVVNKEFKEYPNTNFESYIDNVEKYIETKEKRTYVAPPEPTLDELKSSKIEQAKVKFGEKRDAIRWVKVDDTNTYGFDCANEDITNFLAARTYLAAQVTKSSTTQYKVWLTETTKGIVDLTLEQMDIVFTQVRASQFEAYAWLEDIQKQIEGATTIDEVNKIQIN